MKKWDKGKEMWSDSKNNDNSAKDTIMSIVVVKRIQKIAE